MLANRSEVSDILKRVLGYLNFSSGATDLSFLAGINAIFPVELSAASSIWQGTRPSNEIHIESSANKEDKDDDRQTTALEGLKHLLEQGLDDLRKKDAAFHDASQAEAVLRLVFDSVLPQYRAYHRDLLFHHTDESLWQPLLVARVFESVLQQGSPWDATESIVKGAICDLNDFVGHRPVVALETRKLEPYAHEWSRPIPLYIRGAGVAAGRYEQLIERCLTFLQNADSEILQSAHFELECLQELSIDPRACDFDHPASKRPNYLFGQWDAHQIDQKGYYYRFVVRDIVLEALICRVEECDDTLADELLTETAAVLAGTILMASGISGSGPGAHDSTTSLGNLLPRIATYRDHFYEQTLNQLNDVHRIRLEQEAANLQQPFGATRQDLNARLARHRALQVQHAQLGRVFARMGYPEAAVRQTAILPVTSARMICKIDCLLLEAEHCSEQGSLDTAVDRTSLAVDLLHRAIECGAMVDPWNILGFESNYSLFPAPENSIHDDRVDALMELMERVFSLYAKLWSESAARDEKIVSERISAEFRQLADWWHQFAVHEMNNVEGIDAQKMFVAAERAAQGLALWHQGGAATGDVRFWAPHAEMFDSPQAFAMVVNALLDQKDYIASMSLLIYWLNEAGRVGLEQADISFQKSALRWLRQVKSSKMPLEEKWNTMQKFFDYFEANAQEYWQIPTFDLAISEMEDLPEDFLQDDLDDPLEEEEDQDGLYGAAYEEVVFRDSTDDGVEGSIYDEDHTSELELDEQTRYLCERLGVLECLAELWQIASCDPSTDLHSWPSRGPVIRRWLDQLLTNRRELLNLVGNVHRFTLPTPAPTPESLIQYDRRRLQKETILEKTISTALTTCDATRFVLAALFVHDRSLAAELEPDKPAMLDDIEIHAAQILSNVLHGNIDAVHTDWDRFLTEMRERSLLYVPLSRHGDPRKILRARLRQHTIEDFLQWLPRLGLLKEACELIDTTRQMERNHPTAGAAVTEFDSLFETGFQSIVEAVVKSASSWATDDPQSSNLVDILEPLTQSMLLVWLAHSRTLRLSALERVSDSEDWEQLVDFIHNYGNDLFTQTFLGLGNIRAILHQGVGEWLDQLAENDIQPAMALVDDVDRHISHEEAAARLTLILESIVENYSEYRDYNSTTTQSDRGDLLYTLLDFLRLRVEYDRVKWNLKPIFIAHGVLVRNQRNPDAEIWRRALVERTQQNADVFFERLSTLQKTYAMQMPTISDRLKGRFVRPMIISRLCALVEPAIEEASAAGPKTAFDLLEKEAAAMARDPAGVGLEMPDWLAALDREVRNLQGDAAHSQTRTRRACEIVSRNLSREEIQQQLKAWQDHQE